MMVKPFIIAQPYSNPANEAKPVPYPPENQSENCPPYIAQAMQYPPERYFEDCYHIQKAAALEQVKTNGEIMRTTEKEKIRLVSAEIRSLRREEEGERKKAQFEELEITETGQIHVVTRNLRVEAKPREVANMTNPSVTILARAQNVNEKIFLFVCYVGRDKKELYFEPEKIGSGSYLIKKFVMIGVLFKQPTAVLQKKYAVQLVCDLINKCSEEKLLPEMPGWMRKPDGTYIFMEKEEETWGYVKKKL